MPHDGHAQGLIIRCKRDLTALCEVEDAETGAVKRSTYTYVEANGSVWFGQMIGVRKYDLTLQDLRRTLKRIPDEIIYPPSTPDITVLQEVDARSCYIKRPQFLCLDSPEETELLPRMLIEEAQILELLALHPHPNLVRYHGCTSRHGRLTGLVLERFDVILQFRIEHDPRDLDIAACVNGIRAGIKHLHALGLAHNDITPFNVALDETDTPVILDFGSCRPFGETLLSAGTPGWVDEDFDTSARHHDEIAIHRLEAWLVSKKLDKTDGRK